MKRTGCLFCWEAAAVVFVKNVSDVFDTDVAHVEMGIKVMTVPSFLSRDNSVHLHECSPFWVGIFITFDKENYHVYCFM